MQLDAENYREKREQSLQHLARKVAAKGHQVPPQRTLEPMNAYGERHVIHTALQDAQCDDLLHRNGAQPPGDRGLRSGEKVNWERPPYGAAFFCASDKGSDQGPGESALPGAASVGLGLDILMKT